MLTKMEGKIEDGTWVFLGGQQGLYGAIHFMSSSHIRFAQATVGKEHSFKLVILAKTIQTLHAKSKWGWTHVDFVMLRLSDEKERNFRIKTPDAALPSELRRLDGKNRAGDKDWQNNARERFLSWED